MANSQFGPCGCGKPVVYQVGDGEYACNKVGRCITYAELKQLLVERTLVLRSIRAIITHSIGEEVV